MRSLLVFCSALLLVACEDPHDTKVPADISMWRNTVKPSLQKLTPDEQALFTQYVRRHTILPDEIGLNGDRVDPIPDGMTLGNAIEEQRNYLAHEKDRKPAQTKGTSIK